MATITGQNYALRGSGDQVSAGVGPAPGLQTHRHWPPLTCPSREGCELLGGMDMGQESHRRSPRCPISHSIATDEEYQ